ncbi:hypothetical protein OG196_42865 [Kitasatospora purpeofusca]|uniref:hypothetical protein n=1 Tax=Kitasatospora purpeofusca TaxID=67352 RepID=UPI002E0E2DB1|nr:hypothetical protein OG196_00060 [Kitasatospora purpeofusca]WSR45248.1 hypothetical protein OG196_42865 [Kitasatospora purpeofusca]
MARNSVDQRAIEKHMKEIAKGYERAARRNPIRVPVQTEASVEGGATAGRDTTEGDPVLARLLLWLDDRARENPSHFISTARFIEELQLHDEDPDALAFELEQRDLATLARHPYALIPPDVRLTDAGRATIHHLKKRRLDRAARLRYTMDAFHRWLFDTTDNQNPIDPTLFLTTSTAYFAGTEITEIELREALTHLIQHKLIEGLGTDPATITITSQGIRCALAGGSVQDHVNQASTGPTYNNYLPNAKGVIIGEQQNFTQNNSDGVDPTLFAQLAGYVGQVSATLGVSDTDRAELEQIAQDLHAEASSPSPEPGRLRQAATQLKDKLLEAGTTIAATMGVQLADQALAALTQ